MKKWLPNTGTKKNQTELVLWAFLISNLIWAAAGPVIILTVNSLPPVEFLFYRFLITCTVLLPVVLWELKKAPINLKDAPTILVLGLLGYGSMIIMFEGFKHTSAIDAAIIGVSSPIIAAFAGNYFYKEKLTKKYKIGILLAIFGTLAVVVEPAFSAKSSNIPFGERIYGNTLMLIYNACLAFYFVLSKEIMGKNSSRLNTLLSKTHIKKNVHTVSPFMQTALSFFVALGFYTILFSIKMFKDPMNTISLPDVVAMENNVMYGLLYMALISGITAYTLMNWGLKHSTVSYSAIFTYLGPVFTLPFAYSMLGELPTPPAVIGSIVIGVGVVIAEYSPGKSHKIPSK